jgi:pyruvate formate lyase activating enzyme
MPFTAPVFDIQTLATRDGEGLRTLVFLQGCPLRCAWCANPEGQSTAPQLLWHAEKCVGDLACASACPKGAVTPAENEGTATPRFERRLCDGCDDHACVASCPAEALSIAGRPLTPDGLFNAVRKDIRLFWNSGGGVTFGGGEPLLHAEFVAAVADRLLAYGVGTVIETCGEWEWAAVAPALERAERIYFDMKTLDPERHRRFTGRTNGTILANLKRLAETMAAKVVVSLPIIPGVGDTVEDARGAGRFLASLGLSKARLLTYHRLGVGKYALLGRQYPFAEWDRPVAAGNIAEVRAELESCGIEATIEE